MKPKPEHFSLIIAFIYKISDHHWTSYTFLNELNFGDKISTSFNFHMQVKSNQYDLLQRSSHALGTISKWPERLTKVPCRAVVMKNGLDVFKADARRWARRVAYYRDSLHLELKPPAVCNAMDMNAFFRGFAAALSSDPVWVMNVIPARKPLTLDVIYNRGLIGVYHDWCEPFSTYPCTYDLIHVSGIESLIKRQDSSKSRCSLVDLMVEMDRILHPEGKVVIRDSLKVLDKVARMAHAVRWSSSIHDKEPESHGREKILIATKSLWKLPSNSH